MGLFGKKIPPVPTKADKIEVIDATIREKDIDYKAEYEKLTKKPTAPPELPKFEEKVVEEQESEEKRVISHFKGYVAIQPSEAETIKINLLFSILDELKKLNEKAE
jgi:hypothetical protein